MDPFFMLYFMALMASGMLCPIFCLVCFLQRNCFCKITVTNTADSGKGSLRDAIAKSCDENIITFSIPMSDAGYNAATGKWTIIFTGGEIACDKNLTINGGDEIILDGNNANMVFKYDGAHRFSITGLAYKNCPPDASENRSTLMTAFINGETSRYLPIFKRFESGKKMLGWNWWAFVFGFGWFCYRKMHVAAIIYLSALFVLPLVLIQTGHPIVFNNDYFGATLLGYRIFIIVLGGCFANHVYWMKAKSTIEKSKSMPSALRLNYLQQNGGGSLGAVAVFVLCCNLALLLLLFSPVLR
jgi:Protein of unknown function (DUF2628).